ncbi:ABC-type branched-subunit amino acid transport system substrate-binding protein [Bradyrhizobium sp. LM2.7]
MTDKSKDQGENNVNKRSRGLTRRTMLSGAAAVGLAGVARAQAPGEIKVGLIVPLSGIYTRPGQVMKMGAEMGIEHINAQGGIKALGGARLKLVVIDCGDTTEKAKNAAQRMVAQEPDLVAATGSYLSSFTLAVTEVTERAELPVLTLSYSDLLTDRGFRYIFQTAAPASRQSELGLPTLMKLAENASGKKPKTVAMLMDNTATSVATAKALKERLFAQDGLHLVVEEVWTPPLSDATPLIQKVRSAKPDLLLFMPNAVSDAKLGLEKISEFGLGQGKIPTVSFSITIAETGHAPEREPGYRARHHDHRRQLGLEGSGEPDRRAQGQIQGALDDAERHLDLWRHVADEGGTGEGRQGRPQRGRTGLPHHGCRTVEILSGRRAQIRREGSAHWRRRRHRAMAIGRARHRLSARARAGAAVLAEEILNTSRDFSGRRIAMTTNKTRITRRTLLAGASGTLIGSRAWAQQPAEVKVGLLVPISGLYARPGTVMREGAEMAVDHINAQGGVKALGGARLKLVVLDSGDTTEKAKNAAQRMVAQEADMVAASGAYLSSFTLAVTEVTERVNLPLLTLSYSDLITDRGFKYVSQTSATAGSQARQALPQIIKLAETTSGKRPKTVAILTDNTAASIASAKSMREGLLAENQLQLIVDETFTPPLADATSLVQKIRSAKPDLLFFLPTVISDAKLLLEKMNEFGLGQGKVPTISFGIAIAEPDMLQTVSPELLQGVLTCVASWGAKGHEALIAELKTRYKEPWMTQNAISTYGDIWVIKDALEKAGKADRVAVGEALSAPWMLVLRNTIRSARSNSTRRAAASALA